MAGHWIDRGDLWKSKARTLQLQLRERLRVVVDRRRRRPVFSGDGYLSSSMKRWIQRFRNFRSESLASSSMFCRRRVSKNLYAEDESVITRMLQALAVPILGNVCHVFMHGFNRVQVYGAEKLHEALLHRPKDKPLITVSNHVASMDDPLVIASLLPPRVLMDAQSLRWTLCASDRCFKSPLTSAFFRCVKVLPVSRGDGVHQKGLDLAISKLNNGGWVHIFPEGSRSRDGGRTMGSAKRGVGRLVLDADNTPVVVPFVHTGMQEIMPIGANFPRIGKTVTVLIGDPIEFDDLLNGEDTELAVKGNLYDAISSRIGNRLHELKLQLDRLALDQSLQMTNPPLQSTNQAPGIMHQVDWESFGMDNFMISQDDLASKLERKTEHQQLGPHSSQTGPSISYQRPGLGHECGTVSRIEGYMGFTDLMGFAARGLLLNRSRDKPAKLREVSPLKAWRRFLEASLVQL